MRISFNNLSAGTVIIAHMRAVIYIVVVDDSGLVNISGVIRRASPVAVTVRPVHILRAYEYPPAIRAIEANAYRYART